MKSSRDPVTTCNIFMACIIAGFLALSAWLWVDEAYSEVPEPPFEYLLYWQIEELPGKATLYFDIDGDESPDLVYAHQIIGVERIGTCKPPEKKNKAYWLSANCESRAPIVYLVSVEYIAHRYIDESWHFVSKTWPPKKRMPCKNYSFREIRCKAQK